MTLRKLLSVGLVFGAPKLHPASALSLNVTLLRGLRGRFRERVREPRALYLGQFAGWVENEPHPLESG